MPSAGTIVRLIGVRSRDGDEDKGGVDVGPEVSRSGGGTGARRVPTPGCTVSSSKRPRKDVGSRAEDLIVTAGDESFGKISGDISAFNAAWNVWRRIVPNSQRSVSSSATKPCIL